MNVPEDLKYAESHEWLRVENGYGVVGITDHAQAELTDIVYVEVPKIGTVVEAKQTIAVVESVKAASDIYSPVAGEVVEVNTTLEADPALVNNDPFGAGWIFKLKLVDGETYDGLLDAAGYAAKIG